MKHKSVGHNVTGLTEILISPVDKKNIIVSLLVSNKNPTVATIDLFITKDSNTIILLKDSIVQGNSMVSVINEEVYLDKGDSISIEPSIGADLDVFMSYKEVNIFAGF